jgi:hypothetical protein
VGKPPEKRSVMSVRYGLRRLRWWLGTASLMTVPGQRSNAERRVGIAHGTREHRTSPDTNENISNWTHENS